MNEFTGHYASVIWVTLAYLLLYYVFLIYGLKVKLQVVAECRTKGEPFDRYNGQYPELLAADRMQLNTLEHMPPFLTLLWLQAAVDTPQNAATMGSVYVLLRVLYPFFLGKTLNRYIPKKLLINTFTGYAVLVLMMVFIVKALLSS